MKTLLLLITKTASRTLYLNKESLTVAILENLKNVLTPSKKTASNILEQNFASHKNKEYII